MVDSAKKMSIVLSEDDARLVKAILLQGDSFVLDKYCSPHCNSSQRSEAFKIHRMINQIINQINFSNDEDDENIGDVIYG